MGGRFGLLALFAVFATAALQGTTSAQSGPLSTPDSQAAVSELPASRSLDAMRIQVVPTRGVRPLGREAEQLLTEAQRLSPTVRRLLAQLERSDLFVYVEFRIPRPIRTGQLALLASAAGVRYLKIEIFGVNYVEANIPWLAHELQHAVEIASAPDVTDDAGVKRLYRRIGRPSHSGQDAFETMAAIDVRYRVLQELQSPPGTVALARLPRW